MKNKNVWMVPQIYWRLVKSSTTMKLKFDIWSQTTWVYHLLNLGKSLNLTESEFLICVMGIVSPYGYWKEIIYVKCSIQ